MTLVTGGNGWLSAHVVRRLASAGEAVVSYNPWVMGDEVIR